MEDNNQNEDQQKEQTTGTDTTSSEGATGEPQNEKTFTQSELNAILAKERKKYETKAQEQITEAEKLAKMNKDEKAEHLREQREKELNDRDAAITRREIMADAKGILIDKGLDVSLAELLDYSSAEACKESINRLEKSFKAAVEKTVDERLKSSGSTPRKGSEGGTKDAFLSGFMKR